MSTLYYIVAINKTMPGDPYVCFWRPDNGGYSCPLSWSGKYTAEKVQTYPGYYHNGEGTLAVRCEVVDALGVAPKPHTIDGDAGPVVNNTRENWDAILGGVIYQPPEDPAPRVYRILKGGRRS